MDTEAFLGVPYTAGKRGIFAFFKHTPIKQGTVVIFQKKQHIFQLIDNGVYQPNQDALINLMVEINDGQYDETVPSVPLFIQGAAGTYISTALHRLQKEARNISKRNREGITLPHFFLHLPKQPCHNGFIAFFYNKTTYFYIVHTKSQCLRIRDQHIVHFNESQKASILRRFSQDLSQTLLPARNGEMIRQLPTAIAYIFLEAISCTL